MARKAFGKKPYSRPYKSDGTQPALDDDGHATLTLSTTYYFPLGGDDTLVDAIHANWPSTIVLTSAMVETSNLDPDDERNTWYSSTVGHWLAENPSTAYVPVVGTGVSPTNATVAATGNAGGGGAMWNLSNLGGRRKRLKVVVGATGGTMRVAIHGKD